MRRHALVAFSTPAVEQPEKRNDYLSVALPRPATECYALFCDVARTPEWLKVIRYALVTEKDRQARPKKVSFLASLQRASIGYSCSYRYRNDEMRVAWSTSDESAIRIRGFAQFQPLGDKACLMTYCLDVDLGNAGLPAFDDELFQAHASSATLSDFRDFVIRTIG